MGTRLAEETGLQRGVPPVISGALGRDMELLTFAAEGDPLWATTSTRSSFAVEAGVPYAIDFMNPAPDADFYSVGQDNFHWIVDAVASLAIEKARTVSGTSDQIRCLSLLNGEPRITKQLQATAATSPTGQGISASKSRTPAKKMEASATAPPAKKSFSPKYAARPHSRNDQTVTRQSKSAESGALSRPGNAMRPASRLE